MSSLFVFLAILIGGQFALAQWQVRRAWRRKWGIYDPIESEKEIDEHIARLVKQYDVDTFQAPELRKVPFAETDRQAFLLHAVQLAADRFQVTLPPTTEITFADRTALGFAGADANPGQDRWYTRIEGDTATMTFAESGDGIWRIRVASQARGSNAFVTIAAAHELAHLVLHRDGLPWRDEHLIDTAVVMLGYGPLMLDVGNSYLHPLAVRYAMKRRRALIAR